MKITKYPQVVKTEEDFKKIKKTYKREQKIYFKCDGCKLPIVRSIRHINEFPCMCRTCSYKYKIFNKYGVINNFQRKDIKEKIKQIMFKKHGVYYHSQTKEHWEHVTETSFKKYGTRRPAQSKKVKEKQAKTNIEKYGGISSLNNIEVYKKAKETMINKYGVEHAAQNEEIRGKQRSKYSYENIKFDSSWELAYYIWLKDNNFKFIYQPEPIIYFSQFDNKNHKYFPDFKVNNELIEIKSEPWLKILQEGIGKNKEKYECMIKNDVKIISNCDYYLDYVKSKNIELKNYKI